MMRMFKEQCRPKEVEEEEGELVESSSSLPRSTLSIDKIKALYKPSSAPKATPSSYTKKARQDLSCASDTIVLGLPH